MRRLASIGLLILVAMAALVAGSATLIPAITGWQPVTLESGSMAASGMPVGTLVYISDAAAPKVGDVATYRFGQATPITHELIATSPDPATGQPTWFIGKGSSNPTADTRPIDPAEIVGVVQLSIPYLGVALKLLSSIAVQVFLVALAIGLYWTSRPTPQRTPQVVSLTA
jgi:signal peptidase I